MKSETVGKGNRKMSRKERRVIISITLLICVLATLYYLQKDHCFITPFEESMFIFNYDELTDEIHVKEVKLSLKRCLGFTLSLK